MNKRKSVIMKLIYIGLIIVIFMGMFLSNYGILHRIKSKVPEGTQLMIGLFLLILYIGLSYKLLVKYNKTIGIKSRFQSFRSKFKKEDNDKIERPRIY